jgi:hypothetical protein
MNNTFSNSNLNIILIPIIHLVSLYFLWTDGLLVFLALVMFQLSLSRPITISLWFFSLAVIAMTKGEWVPVCVYLITPIAVLYVLREFSALYYATTCAIVALLVGFYQFDKYNTETQAYTEVAIAVRTVAFDSTQKLAKQYASCEVSHQTQAKLGALKPAIEAIYFPAYLPIALPDGLQFYNRCVPVLLELAKRYPYGVDVEDINVLKKIVK